jgi:hypothetical protein
MTGARAWADLLRNPEAVGAFYERLPPLEAVVLRSVHLDRWGPTLTLRLDLPRFADRPLPEWVESGCDRLQCHLQFVDVADVRMRGWRPPATADVGMGGLERRRVAVRIAGEGVDLAFTSSDSLVVGRMSVYRAQQGGLDTGPHQFVGKVDRIRCTAVPDVWEKTFYERV